MNLKKVLFLIISLYLTIPIFACTSMLVSAKASSTGRPLMWKHRDTGAPDNFIEKVDLGKGHSYVALFNGGDSLLREAWMGMNDAGFAIMNTASYNLMPDTAKYKDQEGYVMSKALNTCRTVDDFERLLKSLPKPMGVQANFGVMDAYDGLAYFETDDYHYVRFDVKDSPTGYLIRTNYSESGDPNQGYGYIRYQNLLDILSDKLSEPNISPIDLTERASRSFWHSLQKIDFEKSNQRWVVDQDFIPRNISTASIVIEGVNPGMGPRDIQMWATIGYPPCSSVKKVTLGAIPPGLRPLAPGFKSPDCLTSLELKKEVFPKSKGNGSKYIDMNALRHINAIQRQKSLNEYKKYNLK